MNDLKGKYIYEPSYFFEGRVINLEYFEQIKLTINGLKVNSAVYIPIELVGMAYNTAESPLGNQFLKSGRENFVDHLKEKGFTVSLDYQNYTYKIMKLYKSI